MLNVFKSVKNQEINLQLWKEGKIDVLFINGLSGSGKSTVGKKLAKEFNAKYVALDGYYYKLLCKREGVKSKKELDLKKVGLEKGMEYVLEDFKNERVVIEGGQIRWFDCDKLKQYAVVFVGTSFVVSSWRAICRDFEKEHWEEYKCIEPWVHVKYNWVMFARLREMMQAMF